MGVVKLPGTRVLTQGMIKCVASQNRRNTTVVPSSTINEGVRSWCVTAMI